jgi:lysophospholipase L1-like esterase
MHKTSSFWMKAGSILLIFALFFSCSSPPPSYIILCAGDSITEVGYPKFLRRILRREGIRAKVVNHGKSGFNSKEYLAFLLKNKTALADSYPDFICLQLGTNDIRTDHDNTSADAFYANMKGIIRLFQDFETRSGKIPHILLSTIPPIPNGTPFPFSPHSAKRVTEEINPLVQKLALEEKLIFVDNFSVFLSSPHLLPEVHPSEEGYKTLAQNWFRALKKQGLRISGKT